MKIKKLYLIIIGLVVLAFSGNRIRLYIVKTVQEQADTAYEREDYEQAILYYTRAINFGIDRSSNLLWRGRSYFYYDNFDMAIVDFTKALELEPDFVAAYLWRGRANFQKKEYENSISDFTEAIRLDSGRWFEERGDVYLYKGDYDLAILDYNKAIEEVDKSIVIYLEYNTDITDLNQKRDILHERLSTARDRKENTDIARNIRIQGDSYFARGDYDRAIAEYDRILAELHPVTEDKNSSSDQIAKKFAEAWLLLFSLPEEADVYNNRGLAYYYKGNMEYAIVNFEMALAINPDHAEALQNLSRAQQRR